MSEDRPGGNSTRDSLLQELLTTPVGRRWLLKAGLGSAAAIAAAHLPPWDARSALAAAPSVAAAAQPATGAAESSVRTTLQFALGAHGPAAPSSTAARGASAGPVSNLTLIANGSRLPLVAHTAASRATLKAQGGVWAMMDLESVTHYVADVSLPSERAMVVSVQGTRGTRQVLVAQMWHTPADGVQAMATLAASGGGLKSMVGSDEHLKLLGLTADQITSPEHVAQLSTVGTPHTTAVAFVMHHPNVARIDKTSSDATKALLNHTPEVTDLGNSINTLGKSGQDAAIYVEATEPDGKTPSQIQLTDNSTTPPKVITTTYTTIQFNDDPSFGAALKAGIRAGVRGVRQDGDLGQVIDKPIDTYPVGTSFKSWVQPQGVTPQAKPYSPPTSAAGNEIQATVKDTSLLFGTYTEATGGYSAGQVPIRIYNNWVRWVWVYVQYLGKDGNMSANPNATWPNTKYSKSLALLPQVFTVLGIPIWDKNTLDVTLDFPKDAHTARLMYCGLGSTLNDDWRQYFPTDAYPDGIAPKDEVLFAALVTGIVTIGLTVFTLAADIAVASVWVRSRQIIEEAEESVSEAYDLQDLIVESSGLLTASEAASAALAGGAATYTDIQNGHQSTQNVWNLLLGLAAAIPKILFSPAFLNKFYKDIGLSILEAVTADKVLEAIPLLGEVISVLSVVGDLATLAEETAETAIAPWVIENEVNLTYQATITVKPQQLNPDDPSSGYWPTTARKWSLTSTLNGDPMPDVRTDSMNPDGRTSSEPIVLHVTAPFGGKSIQWSFVVQDESGFQVGAGVSAVFPNDDPNNVASEVEFSIVEVPEPITADTVFERGDTVTYSDSAGGYTWTEQVTDTGTRIKAGIQQVSGVSVSTIAGVVGVVWKQSDRYYLRGIPVVENGTTIPMSGGPTEGYVRPPFLLLDPFVGRQEDVGNHVLLEPDQGDAYNVRKVTLGADGSISWVPNSSLGTFPIPVSAAALHSSGRVVAVNTTTGRLAWLQPAAAPRPQPAAYSAGSGTQVGLLQSPIAVAITQAGTVLVLEVASKPAQLSAFDLKCNPIKYFGTNHDQFTQALASAGTYLDLAVDGADHIYLLYYTGDGENVEDYHVDVYNPSGEPLVTHSPGVNVAKLAVDYWRSIYGASFDPLTTEGTTTPRIDPALGVAEPMVSRFDPHSGGAV